MEEGGEVEVDDDDMEAVLEQKMNRDPVFFLLLSGVYWEWEDASVRRVRSAEM